MTAAVEKVFMCEGFKCVIIMYHNCCRSGYIAIPTDHPAYGKPVDLLDIKCHGGLTYNDYSLEGQDDEDVWWIGFDANHPGDGICAKDAKNIFANDKESLSYLKRLFNAGYLDKKDNSGMSLDDMIKECMNIIKQLIAYANNRK